MANWQKGKTLQDGKYTIVEKLGQGGFGATFLADNNVAKNEQDKQVVIKTLNDEIQQEDYFDKIRQDFYNEALRIAKCKRYDDDRIVKIYEIIQEDGLPCIVMEHVDGEDLGKIVARRGALPETEAVEYIKQIGEALISVHRQGFLHRDIKPNNIVVRSDGSGAMLIDFGTARQFDRTNNKNAPVYPLTAYLSGGYTPIEQYFSRRKQAPYTDVYALAGTLYFLLTQKVIPNANDREEDLRNLNLDPLKPLKTSAPGISDRVNHAVMKGLSFSAKDRPQTVEEFLTLLLPKYKNSKDKTTVLIGSDSETKKSSKNLITLGILGVIFVGLVSFIYLALSPKQQQEFTNIELFEPQKGKIKLLYPNDWKVQREPITNELGKFISPKEDDNDTFQESLIVSVESYDLPLEEFTEKTLQQINQNITKDVLNSESITLNDQPAERVVYQRQTNNKTLKVMQSWTLIDDRAYVVTYTAEEDKFNKFEPTIAKMIDSLEFD
ncbi:protein kinase [Waterburya agarophytonicola K14]|uniref:Protein kinase n=1 Tax=Waterburya agarophytonicola KI4 TaxID=2874699 RepID=A0A964BUA2_9CYAN|nr:protein kinase [Waterburya agarophytonicola]MCC0179259.1 protein kinase [Waterburya agarophytonicola KI4]